MQIFNSRADWLILFLNYFKNYLFILKFIISIRCFIVFMIFLVINIYILLLQEIKTNMQFMTFLNVIWRNIEKDVHKKITGTLHMKTISTHKHNIMQKHLNINHKIPEALWVVLILYFANFKFLFFLKK